MATVARTIQTSPAPPDALIQLIVRSSAGEGSGLSQLRSVQSSCCKVSVISPGDALADSHGMSSMSLFVIGFIILIAGLAYGASLAGLATQWIVVGALVLLGLGIAAGVTRTRQRDPSH